MEDNGSGDEVSIRILGAEEKIGAVQLQKNMIELIGSTNVISNGHLKDSSIGLDSAQGKSGSDISVDGTRQLAMITPLTISVV